MSMNPKHNNDDEWEAVDLSTSNYGRQDGTLRSLAQQPVEDDEWEAVDLSIAKRTPAKKEPGFFGGLATFAKRTGSVVADVVPKTIAETIRGGDESLQEGFLDKFIAEQKEDIQKSKRLSPEDRKKTWINTPFGPITHGHLEDAPDSLGYSIANALAAAGGYKAGAIAGTAIGGPGIGTAAGLLAGFIGGTAVSGRATKDQFVDDIKAKFSESVGGRVDEQTEQRWKQIYKEISSDANWYGFWEAAPETVGNMLTFGIAKYGGKLTKPLFAKIKNKIAKKVGSGAVKLAGMLTEEELTEAVTSMKQSQIEAEHGLRDKPLSFGEAAKEVWPTVALVTPIMGGGMQIASRKKPTARDILLDEDEKGATAKDILTKEEPPLESGPLPAPPVEEDLTGAESLEAEEAVAAVGEEALEEAAEVIPEKLIKQKEITKEAFDEAGEIITIEPEHKIKKEWDTTPADENEAWGLMMQHVESVRAGNKDAIDNLKDELESLKSSRNKKDVARKKEIRKEIDALKAQSDILEGRYENEAFEIGMAFVDKARDRAKKAGVPEDALDDFAEDFSMQISQERPYIERNYDRTLEQIFEETLAEYLPEGAKKETEIDTQAQEAATSPDNEMPEPTEAQIEAGNYKKGHIKIQGFDISVENPEGSQRSGTSPDGKKWSITMAGHYGYFKRSEGKDGEQIDVFVNAGDRKESDKAYIVDQVDPKTGKFDEHKVMLGYSSLEVAEKGYLANYEKGWKGLGNITEISIDELKGFVEKRQAKPYKPVFAEPTEIAEKLPERRIDIERRKRISEMTEKEMKKELLINPVTKIPNKRAYQEKEQIDLEQGKISVKTYIDVDSLKYVNDLAGHVAGDELLKTIAKELESITPESYHISGDEFIIRADTEENAKVLIDKLNEHLSKAEIEFTNEKGDKFTYKGLGISYGIHKEERRADELLREHKKRREAERIRAKRGERPPGLRGIHPREDREREGKIVEEIIHEPPKSPKAKPSETVRKEIKGEVTPEEVKPKVEKEKVEVTPENEIGLNSKGEKIYEDEGGRYLMSADGKFKSHAPRPIGPQGEKLKPLTTRELYNRGRVDYLTTQEKAEFDAKLEEKLTKVEKTAISKPKLAAEMTADEMLAEWDKQAGEIEPKAIETIVAPSPAKEKAAETKAHLSKATDAFKAINDILGEKGAISNKIDERKWEEIRPLLRIAFDEIVAAGKSGAEFVAIAIKSLSPKGKPYFEKFVKEDMGKEAPDVTDHVRGKQPQEAKKADDTGRLGVEGAGVVPKAEEGIVSKPVRKRPGKPDDVGVRREVEKDILRKEGSEQRPDSAGSRNGDVDKKNLGRDAGNISGLQRSDYIIKPGSLKRKGSWKDAADNNLDAIELLRKINEEKRPATLKEQKILAKYTGWGASELANKMFPGYVNYGEVYPNWAESGWKPSVERLIKFLTPEEIKTAAKSTQYAHYTNEPIISSIYKALAKMGFTGGKILEPGVGIGNFVGLIPAEMRENSNYTGVEMDAVSAGIAKLLYPNQNMIQGDFIRQIFPKNFFDAAIGNPPFGSTKILGDPEYKRHRFSLHNFFFAKTIDRVKPGGLLVFVTSRYTMDSKNDRARKYISARANLLGAIRLPQTAFLESAGTEVVTDVLFFQKRAENERAGGEQWEAQKSIKIGEEEGLVNEYFVVHHPEMVLGEHSFEGSMYGAKQYTVIPFEGKIETLFANAAKNLPADVYQNVKDSTRSTYKEQSVIERDFDPKNKKEGGLYLSDNGIVMKVDFGSGVAIDTIHKITPATKKFLKGYIKLRDALKLSHKAQLEDGDWEKALKELNKEYASFVKKHGHVNAYTVTDRIKRNEDGTTEIIAYRNYKNENSFRLDCESSLIGTLETITEDGEIVKSKVLLGRTINKPTTPKIESVSDALAVSLDVIGKLDIAHVAKIARKTEDEVISSLSNLIYEQPDGSGHVLTDEYLSGNVVIKLAEAKFAAKSNPDFDRNVSALEKAQPEPLEPKHITVTPGATWIPLKYYNHFAKKVLELEDTVVSYQPIDNSWEVKGTYYSAQGLRGAASDWGTEDRGANEILDSVLNNRTIRITRTIEDAEGKSTVFMPEATAAVNDIVKKIRKRFNSWVWEEKDRGKILLDIYNTKVNVIKGREFDGSHLTLPGMSQHFHPYDYQKRVIWRILQTGNTYMAHAVGAGKTFIMISAGMEMRRLGMINKPIYAVPKHMLGQFAQEFQELYPMSNILVADEENFHTENRRRFMAQATLNDPDAIILTHSSFGLIGVKEETLAPVRDDFLEQMRYALSEMKDADEPKMRLKRMEKRIEQAEQRFNSLISSGDRAISFEEFGADYLFVDEAHEFRKLDFATNRQLKGIDPHGSKRSIGLFIKIQWLERQSKGRSHSFASGTPIVNTLGELYTLQRYFDQGEMEEDGINHFDAWANMFGQPVTAYEPNAAGVHEPVERFSDFINMPELMSRVRMFMDVLTSSQLGTRVDRPKIKGGAPEIVLAMNNPALEKYQKEILTERIKVSRAWKPSPGQLGNPDPIINIITDGKLASIDTRFVDTKAKNDPDSKLNKYIDGIIDTFFSTKDMTFSTTFDSAEKASIKGGAQICFYNNGFGKGVIETRGFNSKAFLTKRLKDAGIPIEKIAWIDDYKTAAQKQTLFKLVRSGAKRILLGSAKKMGTGVNVQNRLTDLHYLDAPWFPADVEQPDGRIIRQGNQNKEVSIRRYATKGSYDETLWRMVARKSKFIDQAFIGDKNVRTISDISETSQYEMAAALASGDERVVELAVLRSDIERLYLLEGAHRTSQRTLSINESSLVREIDSYKQRIKEFEEVKSLLPEFIGPMIDATSDNKKFTERKEFGASLIVQIRKLFAEKSEEYVKLGTISGMDINASPIGEQIKKLDLDISIKRFRAAVDNTFMDLEQWNETDAVGLTKKITNTINGLLSNKREKEQALSESEKKLVRVNKKLGVPFEHTQELMEKVSEAAILEQEIIGTSATEEDIQKAGKEQKAEEKQEDKGIGNFYVYSPPKKKYIKLSPELSAKPLATTKTGTTWGETFFIHRPLTETEGWVISERKSGLAAASGKTQEEAISKLKYNLTTITEEKFSKITEDHIEKYGEPGKGKEPLFSKRKTAIAKGVFQVSDLQPQINEITARWKNAPEVEIIQSQAELPEDIQNYIKKDDIVDGVYYHGKVYIVADNTASIEAAAKTLLHESFGHYGLRGMLGNDFGKIMQDVYISKREEVQKIADEYGYDIKTEKGKALSAEEWLSREAVNKPESGWVKRVMAVIRHFARRLMPTLRLSDAEIRQMLEAARSYVERGRPKISDGIGAYFGVPGYQMAGPKAIGAPTGQLVKAQEMLAEGKDKKEVWRKTGWMKGAEGKWKFEIDDSGAELTPEKYSMTKEKTSLSDILVHDELYKAYPQIKEIAVFFDPKETGGSFDEGTDTITIGTKNGKYEDRIKDVLLHEIAHVIQKIENFAKGGTPETFEQDRFKTLNYLTKAITGYNEQLKKYTKTGNKERYVMAMEGKAEAVDMYQKVEETDAYDQYKRLAGEIEAREVAIRKNLTAEQRRIMPPYVGAGGIPEDQWIITKGEGTSFNIEETPAFAKRKPNTVEIDTAGYLPAEVEKRMARAKGGPKVEFKEKLKERITEIRHQRQHFPDLKNIEDETLRAKVNDILRRHQEIPETAKNEAVQKIQSFTKNLSKDGYNIYRMNIILADMMRDIHNGLTYDGKLPFGFKTTEEVESAYAKFQETSRQHPEIADALKKRSDTINDIKRRLVKARLLKKEVLKDDDYFHHQIIEYWEKKYGMMTGSRDVRTHWRPWMTARKGSPLDYNTDYIEAEYTAISQQLAQLKVVETLKRIKKEADIYVSLKREAKTKNVDNLWKLLRERGEIEINDKTGKEIDPLLPWKQKIAMSNANLAQMASEGTLEYDSEWEGIVDALADSYDGWKANKDDIPDYPKPGVDDARWFHFLSYLINTKKPGANWAATVFKAIRGRDKYIEETLGNQFLTYDKLIPKGYTIWKPDPKKGWFWANVVTDKILEKMQRGEISPHDVEAKKLLAKGRDLTWIIPEGLTTTMDNFKGQIEPAWVGKVADTAMRSWKQYILLNPYSVIRYNLNNTSGDLDATLAYAPEISRKYALKAFKDLWKWHRRRKLDPAIQQEIDFAQSAGALQSGFSVQEVTDVYEILSMDRFVKDIILDEKSNWFTKAEWYGVKPAWMKYWTFVRQMTAMRENTLRLAAYRFFMDNQDKRLYGASNPVEVDAVSDPKEKAAKLARELLGDYGNISKSGEWIRKRLCPFYSWLEINAPRYVYMMRNTKYENRDVDSIEKRAAAVTAKKLILASGKLAIRASMLMGAVTLWNLTMFSDEEEELGETGRRQMHLILGRREDGSIITLRFQGALSDALSFFALEDWPSDMKDVLQDKRTVIDKLKEAPLALLNRGVQAIRPEPKMLGEMISGKSFYPDILRPLPIRDRIEHALRTFKLDRIYREALERPGRGKTPGASRAMQVAEHFVNDLKSLLVYESDPGLLAYYDTRQMVNEWLAKRGDEKTYGGRPTSKGNAFYYYKQAMKYGDLDAAQRYLNKYYELGGSLKSRLQSVKYAHPMSSISGMKRIAFRQSLTPAQEATLQRALEWYNKTYK